MKKELYCQAVNNMLVVDIGKETLANFFLRFRDIDYDVDEFYIYIPKDDVMNFLFKAQIYYKVILSV